MRIGRFLQVAIVLGLVTGVGQFAIDMYLPALPSIGSSLHATPAAVQMSLMVFFIMLGICQLVYGPLSDIFGRKPPIYAGLAIFVIGSVGCAFAPNINVLIGFRALQSLGACAGMVIPRAVVRDLYTGHEATRLMSLLMLIMSISPILAPLTGSFIIAGFGWRAIFLALTIAAVIAFLLAATQLRETREHHDRVDSSWAGTFAGYGKLFTDAEFLGLTLVSAFGLSSFFIYLASASFVIVNHYGLTPLMFSLCFAINAASFFGFTQLTARLTAKYGLRRVIRMAVSGFAMTMSIVAVLFLAGFDSLTLMMIFLFIGYGFLGLILPTTGVLSLENHGAIAGTASALMGALQLMVGAAVMAVSGIFANGTPQPMMLGIAISALIAFAIARVTLPAENGRLPDAAPEET
ncbi:MAG TPA: multidrug effflux MFS transporter [Chthoniobacterales bacterium]|nr:multidrug effflux MFS transporter [Chthoniobacterales bacterium]